MEVVSNPPLQSTLAIDQTSSKEVGHDLARRCVFTTVIAPAPSTEVVSERTTNGVMSMRTKRRVERVDVPCKQIKINAKTQCSPSELIVGMDIKDMPVVGYGRFCGKVVHVCASKCVVVWSDNTKGTYSRTHLAKYVAYN